jgi:hypothetical protein
LRLHYRKASLENLKINLIEGGYIPREEFINLFSQAKIDFYSEVIKEGISQIGKEGDFSVLEREIEDYLINLIQPAKYMFFGPEAIFAYCLAKENELKSLKLIFLAKMNNIPNFEIQERLIPLSLEPELVSFDAGSINLGGGVFLNLPEFLETLAKETLSKGISQSWKSSRWGWSTYASPVIRIMSVCSQPSRGISSAVVGRNCVFFPCFKIIILFYHTVAWFVRDNERDV